MGLLDGVENVGLIARIEVMGLLVHTERVVLQVVIKVVAPLLMG